MVNSVRLRLAVLTIAWIAGCSGQETPDNRAQVDTVNNVIHVTNRTAPQTWSLGRPIISADSVGFTNAVSLAVDDVGNVYVADMGEGAIRVLDSAGGLIRTIGRKGQGPAEFQDIYSLAWLGDTLVTLDPGNGRLGFLSREGNWLGQHQVQRISGGDIELLTSRNGIYVPGYLIRDQKVVRTLMHHTGAGVSDTIELPDLRAGQPETGIDCEFPGGIRGFSIPFSSSPIITMDRSGHLVVARSGEYRIVVLTATGDTVRVMEAPATPRSVSSAEWNDSLTPLRDWKHEHPGVHCSAEDPPKLNAKPVLEGIWFDDEDRMWVERRDSVAHAYDVFDDAGVLVGSMSATDRDPEVLPYVIDNRMYVVRAGETDGQEVMVLEIH
jgi:hypothetical protein